MGKIIFTKSSSTRKHHSRGDLRLKEDEDEDQDSWDNGGEHHPHRETLMFTKRVD